VTHRKVTLRKEYWTVILLAWMYGSINQLVEVGQVAFPIVLLP